MPNSVIIATGSYIPPAVIPNTHFLENEFYGEDGQKLERSNAEIIKKLQEITEIRERRYVSDDLNTSDIAYMAAEEALEGIDRESLDGIIVGTVTPDMQFPATACFLQDQLGAKNAAVFDLSAACSGFAKR